MLSTFYKKLIDIGIDGANHISDRKRLQLLNIYLLIWIHVSLFFILLDVIFNNNVDNKVKDIAVHSVSISFFCLLFFLNSKNLFKVSRILFLIFAFLVIYALSFVLKFSEYTVCYFILYPPLVMSVFKEKYPAYIALFFCMATFNINDVLYGIANSQSLVDINARGIFLGKEEKIGAYRMLLMLKDPVVTILFFATFYLFYYFRQLNEKNEVLLSLERDKVLSDKMILEKQEQELRELNEFKSHFFVNLSHEIRTPLTLIQGYTSQLLQSNLSAENSSRARVINEQTTTMRSIVDDIMDLSKMDTKEFLLKKVTIDVHEFLLKIYTSFKPLFEKKLIEFKYHSYLQQMGAEVDPSLFEKAITNLLSNALKFTPKGGKVQLSLKPMNNGICISVVDTGIGIPKESIEKLFERFYQVKNDITQSQGSGIGLAFVKSIIEKHDFKITIDSVEGKGSDFSISIPEEKIKPLIDGVYREVKISSPKDISNGEMLRVIDKVSDKKKTVLIVDDHEQMRQYIAKVLSNYTLVEAENGKQALEMLNTYKIDLVVTDYMMPVMDGEALVKNMKKQFPKIPVIVLTARTDQMGKLNMLRMGIDGYLFKPFLEEELRLQVARGIQLFDAVKQFQEELPKEEITQLDRQASKFNESLKKQIDKHLNTPKLTVEQLAYDLNMSRSTLNRKAKALLGQNVKDLILEARLQKAKQLLQDDPDLTKAQVAQEVGMSNTSHFFEKYRERFGQGK